MFPLFINFRFPPRLVLAAVVGSVSVLLAGLFVYEVFAQPLPTAHSTAPAAAPAGTVYLSPSAQAAAAPQTTAPLIEVHIANNGLTYIRGAHVVSISGSTIRTEVTLGAGTFVWSIETSYNTQFYAQSGAKIALSDITPGDYLTVTGKLSSAGDSPTVSADIIRN